MKQLSLKLNTPLPLVHDITGKDITQDVIKQLEKVYRAMREIDDTQMTIKYKEYFIEIVTKLNNLQKQQQCQQTQLQEC